MTADTSRSAPTPRVFASFLSLAGGEMGARLIGFFATIYIARQMGPDGFGIIGFAAAVCGYMSVAVSSGFDDLGAREVARGPGRGREIAAGATLVRLAIAIPAYAIVTLFVFLLGEDHTTSVVILVTGLSFFSLASDTGWAHKGLENTRLVGVATVLGQLVYLGFVLALVHDSTDIVLIPISQILGEVVKSLVLFAPLLRGGKLRPDIGRGLGIVMGSGFLVLTRLAKTVIFTFDIVAIGFLMTEADVGLYSAAYRVCLLLLALGFAMRLAYLPAFSRASLATTTTEVTRLSVRAIQMSLAVAVPFVVGGGVVAGSVMTTLFGAEYAGGAEAFRWLLVGVGLANIYAIVRNLLLVYDRTGLETRIMAGGALLNVVLNLLLIPKLGLVGAAMSTVAAQTAILSAGVWAARGLDIGITGAGIFKPAVASTVMAVVLVLVGTEIAVFVSVPLGGLVYLVTLVALRGVPEDAKAHLAWLPFVDGP